MSSEPGPSAGEPPKASWFAKVVGGVGMIAMSRQMAKEQSDDDIPGVTTPNPRAQRIVERAGTLVKAGVADGEVLAEVIEMAKDRTKDLKIASTLVRQDGVWMEEEGPNRVVRILNAAAAGEAITPPRPEHAARFLPVAEFNALDPDVAYEELRGLVPQIDDVESSYLAAFRGVGENGDNISALYPYWRKMSESLRVIVGPDSGSEHVVVQSVAALNLATWQIPERANRTSNQ